MVLVSGRSTGAHTNTVHPLFTAGGTKRKQITRARETTTLVSLRKSTPTSSTSYGPARGWSKRREKRWRRRGARFKRQAETLLGRRGSLAERFGATASSRRERSRRNRGTAATAAGGEGKVESGTACSRGSSSLRVRRPERGSRVYLCRICRMPNGGSRGLDQRGLFCVRELCVILFLLRRLFDLAEKFHGFFVQNREKSIKFRSKS